MARVLALALFTATVAVAQPPAPLPPAVAVAKPAPPAAKYERDLRQYPPETVQAVTSARAAGAWLVRMNQADGRFLAGLNPTLARPTDGISDMAQAYAAWGVAKMARFTGDEKTTACANQAVLALLTQTKVEGDLRVPTVAADRCHPVGFAALLVLAICDLPDADPKRLEDAERLGRFLAKEAGSFEGMRKADPAGGQIHPGHCLQALVALDRVKDDPAKREVVTKGLAACREEFRKAPSAMAAGALLPAAVELLQRGKAEGVAEFAFEMADHLCASQAGAGNSPLRQVGGFRAFNAEPAATSAWCLHGLAAGTQLALHVRDDERAAKYRGALVAGMAFARSLQLTEEGCQHFEKGFRAQYLVGGVAVSPADGNLRVDQTAMLALALVRYLESGADR